MATKILTILQEAPKGKSEIASNLRMNAVTGALNRSVRELQADELIEYTLPEKPNSRLQKYRLTEKGRALISSPND